MEANNGMYVFQFHKGTIKTCNARDKDEKR